jgi:hypothetical protein
MALVCIPYCPRVVETGTCVILPADFSLQICSRPNAFELFFLILSFQNYNDDKINKKLLYNKDFLF